jgi:ubiquinone/menaquinone biosynthesis C-methylase UbiE
MSAERQDNSIDNPWWGEHFHRYIEALKWLPSNTSKVLDIACGTGFGSFFLAKSNHVVVGADISEEAIKQCVIDYSLPSLTFIKADGTNLKYDNNHFDAIVSFETIEHTTAYTEMLNEFKRIVKEKGVVIISTPNILINSPNGVITNKYHTQEWTYEELEQLLTKVFSRVKIYGQKYTRYAKERSIKYWIAKNIEAFLYLRGIRKLPLSLKDAITKILIKKPHYPTQYDYELTDQKNEAVKCKTFFAVCYL